METFRQSLLLLQELGIELPTPAYLVGVLLFGVIGIIVWVMGRRRKKRAVVWTGLALMLYPYLVWGTVPLYAVGVTLCGVAAWFWRRV